MTSRLYVRVTEFILAGVNYLRHSSRPHVCVMEYLQFLKITFIVVLCQTQKFISDGIVEVILREEIIIGNTNMCFMSWYNLQHDIFCYVRKDWIEMLYDTRRFLGLLEVYSQTEFQNLTGFSHDKITHSFIKIIWGTQIQISSNLRK